MSRPLAAARGSAAVAALAALLLTGLAGCTTEPGTELTAQVSTAPHPATVPAVATVTVTVTAGPDLAPAEPDPAPAEPDTGFAPPDTGFAPPDTGFAPPDTGFAPPDTTPAEPDTGPAAPHPAPAKQDPAPAAPDPAPADPPAAAAVRTPSAVTLACGAVQESLADAVIRYEVQALSEDGISGRDRSAAWTDMGTAMDEASRAAAGVPGLAAAAAPALAELTALRDGMSSRADLDEGDAEPWRAARNRLEGWCDGQA